MRTPEDLADDRAWQFISNVENGKKILEKITSSSSKRKAKGRPRRYKTEKNALKKSN